MSMFYLFSPARANTQPYVYLSNALTATDPPAADIHVFLPGIFNPGAAGNIAHGPFTLAPSPPGTDGTLTIAKSSAVWQFDNTALRPFREDYLDFLGALEPVLKPGAPAFVQQVLARYLPLTYAETLYYNYGCDAANGYVDLRPGMRLRIDYQFHQFVAPEAPDYLNGFAGSNVAYYYPCSYVDAQGALQTGFNPFLALLQATAVEPNRGGAGGMIDLAGAANARAYYRLFYPKTFVSSDSAGYSGPEKNIILVGANTRADLRTATAQYVARGNCDNLPVSSTYFRGRATLIPEIQVLLNNTPIYVALGTTIRQLLSGLGPIPRLNDVLIDAKSGLAYYRQVFAVSPATGKSKLVMRWPQSAQVLIPSSTNYPTGQGMVLYSDVQDSFDLPVLGGDAVTVTIPDRQP